MAILRHCLAQLRLLRGDWEPFELKWSGENLMEDVSWLVADPGLSGGPLLWTLAPLPNAEREEPAPSSRHRTTPVARNSRDSADR